MALLPLDSRRREDGEHAVQPGAQKSRGNQCEAYEAAGCKRGRAGRHDGTKEERRDTLKISQPGFTL